MHRAAISALLALSAFIAVIAISCAVRAADSAGAEVFAQCAACHSTDGTNGVGPTLKGVVGRSSANVPGFAYSNPLKRAHLQWTTGQLDQYIANPQAVVPGNVMPYAGMADAQQRAALIAYLATLK